tara:strand:- start:843 stop:1136 length:294 start_codon:yes stop_codon:yes gene_type:complete
MSFFYITGVTEDGRSVASGVFDAVDTHGVPLSVVLDYLETSNMVVDWINFYESACSRNWKTKTIFQRIVEALRDTNKDKQYIDRVVSSLVYYVRNKS